MFAVLVVPAVADDGSGRLRFEQLIPEDASLERIANYLDERRTIGARVVVEPPALSGCHGRGSCTSPASLRP